MVHNQKEKQTWDKETVVKRSVACFLDPICDFLAVVTPHESWSKSVYVQPFVAANIA